MTRVGTWTSGDGNGEATNHEKGKCREGVVPAGRRIPILQAGVVKWMIGALIISAPAGMKASEIAWNNACGTGLWNTCCDTVIGGSSYRQRNFDVAPTPAPNCPSMPGSSDDVSLGGFSVALNQSASLRSISSGGPLTVGGNLSVSTTGDLAGPVVFQSGGLGGAGTFHLDDALIDGNILLNRATVVNEGVLLWDSGNISVDNNIVLNNEVGALFEDTTSGGRILRPSFSTGQATISNLGTFQKTAGVGATSIEGTRFDNSGLVVVDTGTLWFRGQGDHVGDFEANGGVIQFGGTQNLLLGSRLLGEGVYRVDGGMVIASGHTVEPAQIELISGSIRGPGNVSVSAEHTWTGGAQSQGGTTTIQAGALLALDGSTTKQLHTGRQFSNEGTAIWSGAGNFGIDNNAIFHNRPGGAFNALNDASIVDIDGIWPGGLFDNQGTFTKSGGTGTTSILKTFDNSGLLDVQTGTVILDGGGTGSGEMRVADGAALQFDNSYTLAPGATWMGAGLFSITAGTITVSSALSLEPQHLQLSQGALSNGTINIAQSFDFLGGSVAAGGLLRVSADAIANLAGSATKQIHGGRTFENEGLMVWTGTGHLGLDNNAVLHNAPGGLFDIQNDRNIQDIFPTLPGGTIDNEGMMVKSAGTGVTHIQKPVSNSGSVVVRSGTFRMDNLTDAGGAVVIEDATFQVPTLTLTSGSLEGRGTLVGNVSGGGIIQPGLPAGTLQVTGNVTRSSAADLSIDIGGTVAGTEHDVLSIGGSAALNGSLSIALIDGFVPSGGEAFEIVTSTGTISGNFGSIHQPEMSGSLSFVVQYEAHRVVLEVVGEAGSVPFDGDGDGDVDLVDFGMFQLCYSAGPIPPACEAFDGDGDGDVDLVDFGGFQLAFVGS